MNTYQIVSLCVVAAVAAWYYLPSLPAILPKKSTALGDIADIVRIRDASESPEVAAACNALLQVMLEVK